MDGAVYMKSEEDISSINWMYGTRGFLDLNKIEEQ
jgi:hypothetical protein